MAAQLEVKVTTEAGRVGRRFRELARDQVPFASARALTQLAKGGQDVTRARMKKRFKIRGGGVLRGVRIRSANKRDWPRQSAVVGTKDAFMVAQMGDRRTTIKRPERGARHIAIPTKIVRRTKTGKIRAAQKPRRIRDKGGAVVDDVILRPLRKRGHLRRVRVWYLLRRWVRIRSRMSMRREIERYARRNYGRIFQRSLLQAIRTRR